MGQVLYFAYGSNLDGDQMRLRCPSARVEARAVLPEHAVTFSGFSHRWNSSVATVVLLPGGRVSPAVLVGTNITDITGCQGATRRRGRTPPPPPRGHVGGAQLARRSSDGGRPLSRPRCLKAATAGRPSPAPPRCARRAVRCRGGCRRAVRGGSLVPGDRGGTGTLGGRW